MAFVLPRACASSASWAPASRTAAARARRRARRRRRSTATHCSPSALGHSVARGVRAGRRGGVPRGRGGARVPSCSRRRRRGGGGRARGRQRRPPSACATRSPTTVTVLLDVEPETAWERVRARQDAEERPLAPRPRGVRRLHAEPRGGCTRSWPTRSCRRSRRDRGPACAGRPAGARGGAERHAHAVGERRVGRIPGVRRRAACSTEVTLGRCRRSGRSSARARAPFCVSDETVLPPLRRRASGSWRARSRSRPASAARRSPSAETRVAAS